MTIKADTPFAEAQLDALGRNFALVFRGMVENGMERGEALEVLKEWVRVSLRPQPPVESDD